MLKLYNIFESLIMESVMRDAIIDVINNKQRVNITYQSDDKNEHTGKRTIEVYTYGIAKNGGYEAIRAYQLFGDTNTVKPMWKFFKVDNILSWEPINSFFKTSIEDRDTNHVDYRKGRNNKPIEVNHNGDKDMSVVHAQAKFDNQHTDTYVKRKEKENWDAEWKAGEEARKERDVRVYQGMQKRREQEKLLKQQELLRQQELQQDQSPEEDEDDGINTNY